MPAYVMITHDGQTLDLASWARYYNIPYKVLYKRYEKHGTNTEKLFRKYKPNAFEGMYRRQADLDKTVLYRGHTKTIREWCEILELPPQVVRMRYRRGVMGGDLFKPVVPRERSQRSE